MNTTTQCVGCGNVQTTQTDDPNYGTRCYKCGRATIPVAQSVQGPDSPPPTKEEIERGMATDMSVNGAADDSHWGIRPDTGRMPLPGEDPGPTSGPFNGWR